MSPVAGEGLQSAKSGRKVSIVIGNAVSSHDPADSALCSPGTECSEQINLALEGTLFRSPVDPRPHRFYRSFRRTTR